MRQLSEYRLPTLLVDLSVIGAIAGLLISVHFLVPGWLQQHFVFQQSLDRPITLVSSAYFHLTNEHLFGNVTGFLLMALYTWMLCMLADQRRWFWLTMLSFLTILPITVNLTSMTAWTLVYPGIDLPASRGFSGVVGGYGGFLAIALLVTLRTTYRPQTVRIVGAFTLYAVLSVLLVIYADPLPLLILAVLLLGLGGIGIEFVRTTSPTALPTTRREWLSRFAAGVGVILVLAVLCTLLIGLFPTTAAQDNSITNVYAHLAGLVWGAVISRWGFRYWRTDTIIS